MVIDLNPGINWIGNIPFRIAEFFKKENPEQHTGHSMRRTSATWLAEQGVSEPQLCGFGLWKNPEVAQIYIASSKKSKEVLVSKISNQIDSFSLAFLPQNLPNNTLQGNKKTDNTDKLFVFNNCTFQNSFNFSNT